MQIDTPGFGTLLVSPQRIGANQNALVASSPSVGFVTAPAPEPGARRNRTLGEWYPGVDSQFTYNRVAGRNIIEWNIGNGSSIVFTAGASPDLRYNVDSPWNIFSGQLRVRNVMIRVSAYTIPGLVARGYMTQQEANVILNRVQPDRERENRPGLFERLFQTANETTQQGAGAVKWTAGAVIVATIGVLAFLYIPKTG